MMDIHAKRKRLVVLTGAGISAESGISTFRDSGGLWEQYSAEEVASIEGWNRNPGLMLRFYNERRRQYAGCVPNLGHRLIAALEPYFDVTVITQNIDSLHEKAGSRRVIHLHGEMDKVTSSLHPQDPSQIRIWPDPQKEIRMGDRAPDGSQLRPYIVWFGEPVPAYSTAAAYCGCADILLIIGTSLHVYPAAGLKDEAPHSAPIYLIDPKIVHWDSPRTFTHIAKGAGEGMRDFLGMMGLNADEVLHDSRAGEKE